MDFFCFTTLDMLHEISALFWDFTQRRMVSFLPMFRDNLSCLIFKGQTVQISHLH